MKALRRAVRGAAGGVLATVAMSGVMLAAQRRGWMGEQPPEKITRRAASGAGGRHSEEEVDVMAAVAHLGFGAGAGALFGALDLGRRVPGPPPLAGVAYALLIWAAAYKGLVPRLGIMPEPERDRPGRPAAMIVAHVVYGFVLGGVASRGVRAAVR